LVEKEREPRLVTLGGGRRYQAPPARPVLILLASHVRSVNIFGEEISKHELIVFVSGFLDDDR
jgi:hypothetical protein